MIMNCTHRTIPTESRNVMKKVVTVFMGLIALMIIGILALTFIPSGGSGLFDGLKSGATNIALNASGIKTKISDTLSSNVSNIASATGMSESQVRAAIVDLDLENWNATTLPSDAVATGTYSGNYGGTSATITTYENSGYVTINAYGQDVTLEVPDSAQDHLWYLAYL